MKIAVRFQLLGFTLAAGLLGTLIVIITLTAQRELTGLRANLKSAGQESAAILNQFEASLNELNRDMLRYGTDRDQAVWNQGIQAAQKLEAWIDTQRTVLRTPAEQALLKRIRLAHDDYLKVLRTFYLKAQLPGGGGASLGDFNQIREQSYQLFDLGQALAEAHYQAQNAFLRQANQSLRELHLLILALVGLLFAAGGAMAAVIYRHLIAPLQGKVEESRLFAERHERLASIGLLAAGAAEEIRNPLTSVKIGHHFQTLRLPAGSAERAEAEVVEQELRRLEKAVDDFSAVSQLAAPRLTVLDLGGLLKELRQFLVPRLAPSDIHVALEVAAPLRVRADAAQLKQAVLNLVQHAADTIGRNGCITLRLAAEQRLFAGREHTMAILEVRDSGRGGETPGPVYFDEPAQGAAAPLDGLGLSIAAKIVERHGGELKYATQPHPGATFGIMLPAV